MNLAIIFGLVIIGLKTPQGIDANDNTFDRRLLEEMGDKNARKLHSPLSARLRLYRRKINARRHGYFRDTTETRYQSYDTFGVGGQVDLLQEEYGEGTDKEEESTPPSLEYLQALRARVHMEGYNKAEREYRMNKLLMKSRHRSKSAKPESLHEPFIYKGDWVYARNVTIKPSEVDGLSTTYRSPAYFNDKSCLRPCPLIYKFDYGLICAIRWHRPKPKSIRGYYYPGYWFEKNLGTSRYPTYFLKNFTNICEMEVENCIMLHLDTDTVYSWKVMFRGQCPPGMDDEEAILAENGPPGNPEPPIDAQTEVELADQWVKHIMENRKKVKSGDKSKSMQELLNKTRADAKARNPNP